MELLANLSEIVSRSSAQLVLVVASTRATSSFPLGRTRSSDSQAIGTVGVEQVHLPPAQAGPDHQPVEHAQLGLGTYGGVESVDQPRPARGQLETRRRHGSTYTQADVVDEHVPLREVQGEMPGHRFLGDEAEALDGAQQRRQLGPAQGGTAQAEVSWGTGTAGTERHVGVPGSWATIPRGAMTRPGGPRCPPGQQPEDLGPIPGRDLRSRLFGIAGWQALEEPMTSLPLRGQLLTVIGGPVLDNEGRLDIERSGPFLWRCPHEASMSLPDGPEGPKPVLTGGACPPTPALRC